MDHDHLQGDEGAQSTDKPSLSFSLFDVRDSPRSVNERYLPDIDIVHAIPTRYTRAEQLVESRPGEPSNLTSSGGGGVIIICGFRLD